MSSLLTIHATDLRNTFIYFKYEIMRIFSLQRTYLFSKQFPGRFVNWFLSGVEAAPGKLFELHITRLIFAFL